MKRVDFESLASRATESVLTFAHFTEWAEQMFSHFEDADALKIYRSAWFELETVNAIALSEWESDGRPGNWGEKWNGLFLKDAVETIGIVRAAALPLLES